MVVGLLLALPATALVAESQPASSRRPVVSNAPDDSPLGSARGKEVATPRDPARFAFELGFGLAGATEDRYNRRLADFGFESTGQVPATIGQTRLALLVRLAEHASAYVQWAALESREYTRDTGDVVSNFQWNTQAATVGLQAELAPPSHEVGFFVRCGAGATLTGSTFTQPTTDEEPDLQSEWGWIVDVGAGLWIMASSHFGFQVEGGTTYAPGLSNLLGDVHDSGGAYGGVSLRVEL